MPYGEQCDIAYRGIKADSSPLNVAAAFSVCGRAQETAGACLNAPVKVHRAAVAAMYRAVTEQAEIAGFAQQFTLAHALLEERRQVLAVLVHDGAVPSSVATAERSEIAADLRDTSAGECTVREYAKLPEQARLAKAHDFAVLSALLAGRYRAYEACAPLATAARAGYIRYMALVALEESGRAAQAASHADTAKLDYRECIALAARESASASAPVRKHLHDVKTLCAGRLDGSVAVDMPAPLEVEATKVTTPAAAP